MKLLIITQVVDTQHPILGFFHRWIEEFAKQCDCVHVICLQEGRHNFPPNVIVHSLGKEDGKGKLVYVFRFYRLIWQLRNEYDSVFVHMNQVYVILAGPLWRLLKKRVGFWYAHGHMSLPVKIATWFSTLVFTSTESGFRYNTKKKQVVGQGIDFNKFSSQRDVSDPEHLRLMFVGRISPIKGIKTLLEACELLRERGVQFSLSIIGSATTPAEETYFTELKAFVTEQALGSHVSFVGQIANDALPQYLSKADIFINPSSTGSLDKSGVEAMASEVVVLTCNEAYKDVFGSLAPQLMFPKGDAVAIADKVQQFTAQTVRQDIGSQLRTVVVEAHGLERLMKVITTTLEGK